MHLDKPVRRRAVSVFASIRDAAVRVLAGHRELSASSKLTLWLGLAGLMIASLTLLRDYLDVTAPLATGTPSSVSLEGSPLPGYVAGRSGIKFIELNPAAVPSRVYFDPSTWSDTDDVSRGIAVECRLPSHEAGCEPGAEPVFYIDPVEPGTKIAEADTSAEEYFCAGNADHARAIPVQEGKAYCVSGNDRVVVIRVVTLPDRIVKDDIAVPELHLQLWKAE